MKKIHVNKNFASDYNNYALTLIQQGYKSNTHASKVDNDEPSSSLNNQIAKDTDDVKAARDIIKNIVTSYKNLRSGESSNGPHSDDTITLRPFDKI